MLAQMGHAGVPTLVVARLAHELGTVLLVQMLASKFFNQFFLIMLFKRLVCLSGKFGFVLPVHLLQIVELDRPDRVCFEYGLIVDMKDLVLRDSF